MDLKISVITPSFNSADYIERAIKSVLDQNYDNYEHWIIDGGSNDGTIQILKKYTHLKWISEPDNGQSDAMNKGFTFSSGDIIVYLNCDDYFLPGAFERVIPLFKQGANFVVGDVLLQTLKGNKFVIKPNIEYKQMLRHWEHAAFPNNPVQYFYLREVQEKFPFNIKNKKTMDLEFLCDAASYYKFEKVDYTLGVYPLIEGAVSIEAQKDPFYWTFETFAFIDRHLLKFEKDEILEFKKIQQREYLKRTIELLNREEKDLKYKSLIQAYRELIKYKTIFSPIKKYRSYKQLIKKFNRLGL